MNLIHRRRWEGVCVGMYKRSTDKPSLRDQERKGKFFLRRRLELLEFVNCLNDIWIYLVFSEIDVFNSIISGSSFIILKFTCDLHLSNFRNVIIMFGS